MPSNPYNLEPIEEGVDEKMKEKFVAEKVVSTEKLTSPENDVESERSVAEGTLEDFLAKAKANAQHSNSITSKGVTSDVDVVSQEDADNRVNKLVAIAREKGPTYAFEVALKLDDLYTIDRLHDTLSGKLYDELLKKGVPSK